MNATPAPALPHAGPADLAELRARARARLEETGLPTVRLEDWRFTNPASITRAEWPVAVAAAAGTVATLPALGEWPRHEAVLVAGRYDAAASGPVHGAVALPAGVRIGSLAEATRGGLPHALGAIARGETPATAFVAQNTSLLEDGIAIAVPAGTTIAAPVRVTHRRGADGATGALVPGRVLVTVGAVASLTLVEDFRDFAASGDFANAVTEVDLAEGGRLVLVRLIGERAGGPHVGSTWVRTAAGAGFTARTFALGGPLVRDDVHVHFAGRGAEATLDGLFVVSGKEHVDHHTTLDHAVPDCRSRELYKGVLAGAGRGVFNGAVIIRPDAQKSDSAQRNPNLLLSEDATIFTKPELQIWADDVKCAHGATVGQLDAGALFYLRARGIDETAARSMLVHAFAREVVERVEHEGLRADVDAWVEARMERLAREGAA